MRAAFRVQFPFNPPNNERKSMYYKELETVPGAKLAYDSLKRKEAAERLAKNADWNKKNKKKESKDAS